MIKSRHIFFTFSHYEYY